MHQKQEHFHFIRRKRNDLSFAEKLLLRSRKAKISNGNIPVHRIASALHFNAAQERFYPHQKHGRTKRLCQIVVPTLKNAVDIVIFGILCRQQNYGNLVPNNTAAGQPVCAGHHYIQNYEVGASFGKRA